MSASRAKLLFLVPDPRFFVTHRMPLAVAARAAGYDVHVATAKGVAVDRIIASGLTWHHAPFGPMRRKPWSDLQSLLTVINLYRRLRPDVVHHVSFKPVLYGTVSARLNRVPAVVNAMTGLGEVFAANSLFDRFWRWITITLFRVFVRHPRMRVIVQNADDRKLLINSAAVDEGSTVLIGGSGVDPDWFIPSAPASSTIPTVAYASRIMRTKGIAEFCAAARRLLAEGVCARFIVAGEFDRDSGKAIPDDEFDRWTRDGVVQYLGMCDDVREVFAQSDVVCLPSWGGEGVPKALIEAASCGLPIVTTDVAGCRDIVQQGVNGLVVPPRTIEPLAAALRTLIDDPQLRREMGARGRQIVINQFSLSIVIEATLAVYRELEREAK